MNSDQKIGCLSSNLGQHRKPRLKKAYIAIGAFSVAFILGTMLILPIFDDRRGIDILLSSLRGDTENIGDVGEEPETTFWIYPELQPYQIFNAPQLNWSKFWKVFKNHALWDLEYNQGNGWTSCKDALTIIRNYTSENSCKIALDFTAPYEADYRLTLAIDYKVRNYVHKVDKYIYNLSYEAWGEWFNVTFDFSDIASISGIIITHGIKNVEGHNYFWFRARRDNVPENYHVVLDPTYEIFSGSNIYVGSASARKLVRDSSGNLWCTFKDYVGAGYYRIYVYKSVDDGVTWTEQTRHGGATGNRSHDPSMAIDSNDVVHIVFNGYHTGQTSKRQIRYTNSSDWTNIVNLTDDSSYSQSYSAIAIDSNDNIHIVWAKGHTESNRIDVAYINSTDNGGSWNAEQKLTSEADTGDVSWLPSIAINSADEIHIVFMCQDFANTKDQILHMYSDDGGITWSQWDCDVITNDASYDQRSPILAIDDNDVLHVVWYHYDFTNKHQIHYSYNDSNDWSTIQLSSDADALQQYPTISISDDDYVHVVWDGSGDYAQYDYNDTSDWQGRTTITNWDIVNPNLICAQHPTIDGVKTNRPATGYALIVSTTSNVTYIDGSVTWDEAEVEETWQVVNDTINGAFTNTTVWRNVDTAYNGAFTNISIRTWQIVNDTVNGIFTNTTTWKDVDTTINGVFVNGTTWQDVDTTYNGAFTNTTTWQVIDNIYNGEFTNTTSWQNIDTTYNGVFTNTTLWYNVDTSINGEFTNTSTKVWQNVDTTYNGVFTNTTIWYDVDTAYNGEFTNTTTWQDIDTTYNGAFTNTTVWQDVDVSINGEFTNVSIRTWQIVDNTINGVFTNTTTWKDVDTSINGVFANGTTWQDVDTTYNGAFTNTTSWQVIDNIYNGEFTNTSIRTWQVVNDTINGAFTNVSIRIWQNVNTTINGAFTNTTTWQDVDTSINGAFTNTTLWYNVDITYNGAFTNTTVWQDVDTSINGEFTNVSTKVWQNVDTTINGVFQNLTVFRNVDTSINGAFTNLTVFRDVDISINGAFTNLTVFQNVDTSIDGEFTNVSARTWQVVNDTISGVFTNLTLFQDVDISINGVFYNLTVFKDVDISINGEFTNVSVSIITITNPYPSNGSTNIQVNTSIHFTVNHTLGYLMNITVYTGSNLTNCSALLGSFNSVNNGTYYLGYHNASNVSTEYAWRVNVTNGKGNYAQNIYNFTTASTRGEIYAMGNPRGYGMGMVMAFSMAFGMLFLVVGMMLFRRRSRRNE